MICGLFYCSELICSITKNNSMHNIVAHQRVPLDDDFIAVPLDFSDEASVRLSLVVRKEADPVEGPFCRLRQLADANVYLGCFTDCAGHVLKWLELWVRDYDNIADTLHENAFDIVNNMVLDARWDRQRKILELSDASHVYVTTLDAQMECPMHIDLYNKTADYVKDTASNTHWKICKEDNLLRRLELAPYSSTVHRYLYLEALGSDSDFLPVTPNAPQNAKTRSLEEALGGRSTLLPFNRYGGSVLVREVTPMSVQGYLKVLSGRAWDGVGQGQKKLVPKGVYREVSDRMTVGYAAGRLISTRPGESNWQLESLFLKVRLFYEMIAQVKACVELDKKPFFALELSSFGISLPETSPTSPFLWDAEVALNQISDAVDFSVETQTDLDSRETTYFRTFRPLPASIYRPEALGQHRTLIAEVTVLEVRRDRETGLYEISGSLRSADIQDQGFHGRHFYFIDYPVRGKRLRLVAEMTGADARFTDKIEFKTRKLPLDSAQQLALDSFIGVEQVGVYCEILPVLGTPCDLYSLGIIGLEVLFADSGSSLAQLKDELRTLAMACIDLDPEQPLVERIVQVLEDKPDLREILMPEALGLGGADHGSIRLLLECQIWEGVLAVIMKMLSGLLKHESYSPSLSNENNFRLAYVFDEPLRELSRFMAILRSMNVGDAQNAQLVSDVLDEMIKEAGGAK